MVQSGYIAGVIIGQNQFALKTSTEARLAAGFMVQVCTTETAVQFICTAV